MTSRFPSFVTRDEIQLQFKRIASLYAAAYQTSAPPATLSADAALRLEQTHNASTLDIAVCVIELLDEWREALACEQRVAA